MSAECRQLGPEEVLELRIESGTMREIVAQRLEHRLEGQRALAVGAAVEDAPALPVQHRCETDREARLADAWLAGDERYTALAGADLGSEAEQTLTLRLAAR